MSKNKQTQTYAHSPNVELGRAGRKLFSTTAYRGFQKIYGKLRSEFTADRGD